MARRASDEQITTTGIQRYSSSDDESKVVTPSLFRRIRSNSFDDIHRHMIRNYVSHSGAPRTDFPDPKVSRAMVWMRVCLRRLGRGSLDYSLLFLHKNNKFRKKVKRAVKSKLFDIFFAVVVLLNAALLCVTVPTEWGDYKHRNITIAYISTVFLLAYIVESAMRVIAYGLIFHPKAYLRITDNLLDLCTILFGVLYIVLTIAGVYELADVFGALMTIKLIRVLRIFKTVRFILKALAKSMVPLVFVSIMQLCVMIFFTFLGMELYRGCGLNHGCFANYTDSTGELRRVVVSEFPCSTKQEPGVHHCPGQSQCQPWPEGPNYGLTSFGDVRKGLLTVFQLITLEGWTGIFYLYQSACGVLLTWPFFIIAITLGSVLFLNLWLGVLTSVFIGVSERQETETNIRQLKEKNKYNKDLENYHKWIQKSLDMDLPSESGSFGRRQSLPLGPWLATRNEGDGYDSEDEQYRDAQLDLQRRISAGGVDVLRDKVGGKNHLCMVDMGERVTKARTMVLAVVKSRPHFFLKLLVLAVNMVLLMSLHFPLVPLLDRFVFMLNYVLSGFFIMESLLSLFALGIRRYFSTLFHRFDTVLNILNLLDLLLITVLGRYHFTAIINACRSIKLIKIFKYTRYWVSMKQIIHTFSRLLFLSLSLMALVVLFLFMYTIVGYRLFGNKLDVDHNVGLPNFDDLLNSFLLVFQLITTEDWHNVYHKSGRAWLRVTGSFLFTPLYFTTAIMIGGFVLLSIFLSIAVDKLSEVKAVEEEEGREVEQRDRERDDKKRHIHALKHPEQQPSLYRKTLRSARRLLFEGLRVDKNEKKAWQKPFTAASSSSHAPLRRALSTKSTLGTIPGGTKDHSSPVKKPKQSNPLRFVMNPLSPQMVESEDLAARRGAFRERCSIEELDIDGRSSRSSRSSRHTTTGSFTWENLKFPRRIVARKTSTVSTPDTPLSGDGADTPVSASYERTQSLPTNTGQTSALSGSTHHETSESEHEKMTVKLETIAEDGGANEEEGEGGGEEEIEGGGGGGVGGGEVGETVTFNASTEQSSGETESRKGEKEEREGEESRGFPLSLRIPPSPSEREVLSRRVIEQSSLENVFRKNQNDRAREASTDGGVRTGVRWREKIQQMWQWFTDYIGTIQIDPSKELAEIPDHSAFFILSPDNSFRVFCYKLVCSKAFTVITYVTIFVGSVLLTLEIPVTSNLDRGSLPCLIQDVIIFIDLVIVIYFLAEMFLKMTALGVFLHRGSYLRGFFNIMDYVITMTTLVPVIAYFYNLSKSSEEQQKCLAYSYQERLVPVYLATLRVFRVFRPMRAIRISAFYVVVKGLLSSIKSIGRILFIAVLVMSIFAIIGTILFRGSFFYCTDPRKLTERECKGHFFTYPTGDLSCPELNEREWTTHGLNFNNFGQSFLTLFAMITSEGWQIVMYNGYNSKLFQDSNNPVGPQPNASPYSFIFFFLYMCIMTLVLLNMFIGFVIVTFQEVGIKAFRESKLDRNQRNCLYFALTSKPQFRYVPKFDWQKRLLEVTQHPIFSVVIICSLLFNSIILGLQTIGDLKIAVYWINFSFTLLFTAEAIFKITALHPVNYFRNVWNFIEFLSTAGALIEFILQQAVVGQNSDYRYSHFASAFRVLWLLKYVPQVRLIMWTVIKSLEIFPWVGLLLMVVVFTFAVIGMQLFGTIEQAEIEASEEVPGRHITPYNNFANFFQALLVMIRVSTGENWQDIMLSCKSESPCECNIESPCTETASDCGSDATYFFYPFFYTIASILFLNLFVAIIIDNFDYLVKDKSVLGAHQLSTFVKLWSIYDPSASGELSPEKVIKLMKQCNPPVGWGILCPRAVTYRKMMSLNMPLVNDKVTFNSTLFGLVKTSLNIGCSGCSECLTRCNVELKEKLRTLFPTSPQRVLDEILPVEDVSTVRPAYAVHLIQTRWRAFFRKRNETIQLFQERRSLIAGKRRLPDAGPDLVERKLSDFEAAEFSYIHSSAQGSLKSSSSQLRSTSPPDSLSVFRFDSISPGYNLSERRRVSEVLLSPHDAVSPRELRERVNLGPPSPIFGQEEQCLNRQQQQQSIINSGQQDRFMGQHSPNLGREDPFVGQDEDGERSELSFTSAYGSPVTSPHSPTHHPHHHHHRETTV